MRDVTGSGEKCNCQFIDSYSGPILAKFVHACVERDEERRYRRYVQKNMVSEVIFQRLFYKDNLTDDLADII
jgi:hypothetical protein